MTSTSGDEVAPPATGGPPTSRPRPFHPFLLAAFPVLALFARNADELELRELTLPLLVVVGSSIALFFVLRRFLGESRRAALMASTVIMVFFTYGHVWERVNSLAIGPVIIDRDLYLLIPWAVIGSGLLVITFRARRFLPETTTILNAIAAFLIFSSIFSIARTAGGSPAAGADCPPPLQGEGRATGGKPRDIYYLVFDRYAGNETLRKDYGFDNKEFLSYLERRGFYVADDSRANYPRTSHSLASSLNASYLTCLSERISPDENNWSAIYDAITDHEVGRFLQRSGYRYVHIGSWWEVTAESLIADRNLKYRGKLGFSELLYSTTLARPVGEVLGMSDSKRESDYKRTLFQLRALRAMRNERSPKFVFAHLLLPHDPYVFDSAGRFQSYIDEQKRGLVGAYLEQLAFTNSAIRELIDALLAGPEESHPILVLQSDEGPHPLRYDIEGERFDWTMASADEMGQTLRILNAYYLPGNPERDLYETITPVNTFRYIFDRYLGTRLGLLPDEVYVYEDDSHPYRFTQVTDKVSPSNTVKTAGS